MITLPPPHSHEKEQAWPQAIILVHTPLMFRVTDSVEDLYASGREAELELEKYQSGTWLDGREKLQTSHEPRSTGCAPSSSTSLCWPTCFRICWHPYFHRERWQSTSGVRVSKPKRNTALRHTISKPVDVFLGCQGPGWDHGALEWAARELYPATQRQSTRPTWEIQYGRLPKHQDALRFRVGKPQLRQVKLHQLRSGQKHSDGRSGPYWWQVHLSIPFWFSNPRWGCLFSFRTNRVETRLRTHYNFQIRMRSMFAQQKLVLLHYLTYSYPSVGEEPWGTSYDPSPLWYHSPPTPLAEFLHLDDFGRGSRWFTFTKRRRAIQCAV